MYSYRHSPKNWRFGQSAEKGKMNGEKKKQQGREGEKGKREKGKHQPSDGG